MRFTHVKRWTLAGIWARTPRIALATFLICFLSIFIAAPCWADEAATKAARELAQRLAAQIDHKKKVFIEVVDLTGEMRADELWEAKRTIDAELRTRGGHPADDTSYDFKVRVIPSHDTSERLWVAEYESEGAHTVLIAPFERSSLDIRPWMKGVHLDRELIFSDTSPFFDFIACERSPKESCGVTLVLYPASVTSMKILEGYPPVAIGHDAPWPRDVRGRLEPISPGFEAHIEGVICSGDLDLRNAKCSGSRNPWSFWGPRGEYASAALTSGQNWFTWTGGASQNGAQSRREPFFSLAGLEINGEPGWISSGTDGKVRIFTNKAGEILGTVSNWGSELAVVKTNCGNGWQILATRQRDRTETDAVTVYEWTGAEFRSLTDPVEMNGTIVSLWSPNGEGSARAVVRNLKTGNYEAYLLKVGCSQ